MTPAQVKKFLKDQGTRFILATFVDLHGAAKAKAVPASHVDDLLGAGAGFAGFAVWGLGMGPHGPDFMAVGDPTTLKPVPWMDGIARKLDPGAPCNDNLYEYTPEQLKTQGIVLLPQNPGDALDAFESDKVLRASGCCR